MQPLFLTVGLIVYHSDIYYPRLVEREFTPVFVGTPTPKREKVLRQLDRLLRKKGISLETYASVQHDYAYLIAKKFLALNIPRMGEVNWRDFEVLGVGAVLLREDSKEIREFFEPGKHLVTYSTVEDLAEKILWLVEDREAGYRIASQRCIESWRKHTLEDRICKIVRDLGYKCSYPNSMKQEMINRCKDIRSITT